MKKLTKIAFIGMSILGLGTLTACQSTSKVEDDRDRSHRMMKKHSDQNKHQMSQEQREKIKESRAEQHEVMKKIRTACDNKAVGSAVQVQAGEKNIAGTCMMTFKPEHKKGDKKMLADHRPMKAEMTGPMHVKRAESLTDEKRAELSKKFEQRLSDLQAYQQAELAACKGKNIGASTQVVVGSKSISGTCEVRFYPKEMMK